MSLEVLILLLAIMVFLNWIRFRDAIYPGFLQALIWLAVIVVFYLNESSFTSVSPELVSLIFFGVLCFGIGSYCATLGHAPNMKPTSPAPASLPRRLATVVLFWIPLLGLPALAWKARQLAQVGPMVPRYFDQRYINLRARLTNSLNPESFGVLDYVVVLCFFAAGVYLLNAFSRRSRRDTVMFLCLLAAAWAAAVLSTARTAATTLLIMLAFIGLSTRRFFAGRTLMISFLLMELVFGFFGIMLRKGGNPDLPLIDNVRSLYDSYLTYLLGPLPAFEQIFHSTPAAGGMMTLRFFFAVGKAIGFHVTIYPIIQPFTFVPQPVNVYTFYQPYFQDFGWIGALTAQFVVGMGHGFLYRKATVVQPDAYYVFLYSIFMYPLFIQTFNDQYINILSYWLKYLILAVLFFRILNVGKRKAVMLPHNLPSPGLIRSRQR